MKKLKINDYLVIGLMIALTFTYFVVGAGVVTADEVGTVGGDETEIPTEGSGGGGYEEGLKACEEEYNACVARINPFYGDCSGSEGVKYCEHQCSVERARCRTEVYNSGGTGGEEDEGGSIWDWITDLFT